jgi:hypothetical protein
MRTITDVYVFKDSYQYWTAREMLAQKRKSVEREGKKYREAVEAANSKEGLEAKKAAIKELTDAYEKLESDLHERGAKTFQELRPDIKPPQPSDAQPSKTSPFAISLSFKGTDITGDKRDDYLKL